MKVADSLAVVVASFERESSRVVDEFLAFGVSGGIPQLMYRAREACVIEMHDAWARFWKGAIVSSASRAPVSLSGTKIARAPGVNGPLDVLPLLRGTFPKGKPNSWEPRWGNTSDVIDVIRRLKLTNESELVNAIGSAASGPEELRALRNFYAHRGSSAIQVRAIGRRYTLGRKFTFHDLVQLPVPPGVTLFQRWHAELLLVAYSACY